MSRSTQEVTVTARVAGLTDELQSAWTPVLAFYNSDTDETLTGKDLERLGVEVCEYLDETPVGNFPEVDDEDEAECPRCGGLGEEPGAPIEDDNSFARCTECDGRGTVDYDPEDEAEDESDYWCPRCGGDADDGDICEDCYDKIVSGNLRSE